MSRRNRRRRSELELLEEARSILFSGESDVDAEPADLTADHQLPTNPTEAERTSTPDIQMEQMDQLAALAQALQITGRANFKPPTFSGTEDVELFLKHFHDVAEANRWTPLERMLHIRSQLTDGAQSCGQADSFEEIVEDLRARYGLTNRSARDRLSSITLRAGQDIHKQAGEISRLVALSFPMLPEADRQTLALDYFSHAWESKAVQAHLLSVAPQNLRTAVRAAEDFLAIQNSGPRPRAHVVEQPAAEESAIQQPVDSGLTLMAEALKNQTALLQQVLLQLANLQRPVTQPANPQMTTLKCYGCGGPHLKRNCPQYQMSNSQLSQQAGNGHGPAQG